MQKSATSDLDLGSSTNFAVLRITSRYYNVDVSLCQCQIVQLAHPLDEETRSGETQQSLRNGFRGCARSFLLSFALDTPISRSVVVPPRCGVD